ncbi:hypothetical protein HYS00_05560, partial [Candidatus Microgenomates bacterium]|nr:hypothetical protein [Candidatus Microgenomates bacterium]
TVDSHFGDHLSPAQLTGDEYQSDWEQLSQGMKVVTSAIAAPDLLSHKLSSTQPQNVELYKKVIGTHLHLLQPLADLAGLSLTDYLATIGMDPAFLALAA